MKKGMLVVLILLLSVLAFADKNLVYDSMTEKVVLLFNKQGGFSLESWIGSGVIISDDGYIVTNRHVAGYYCKENGVDDYGQPKFELGGNGANLIVYHEDWGYGGCRIVAVSVDPELDLALLKIEPIDLLPYAQIAYTEKIKSGTVVYAVGHPLGVGWMMTKGIISKEFETVRHNRLLIHDASINPGNSGGPLFDEYGYVVGLNYAAVPPYAAENIAIAIDAKMIGEFVMISIEFDKKRNFTMTEDDYNKSVWSSKYFTFRLGE